MSDVAAIAILAVTVLTWAGIALGTRWLLRRVRRHHEELAHIHDPIERDDFRVEFARLTQSHSQNRVTEFVEFSVAVEGLELVDIIDGDALHQRSRVLTPHPAGLATVGPNIETGDEVFDGHFAFVSHPDASPRAIMEPEVRALLLELRDAYGGLWVDRGRIRVVEKGRPDLEGIDINVELLLGIGTQLRHALRIELPSRTGIV